MGSTKSIGFTKISKVKEDWKDIKERLLMYLSAEVEGYYKEEIKECINAVNSASDDISEYSDERLLELLEPFASQDLPAIVGDNLVTSLCNEGLTPCMSALTNSVDTDLDFYV